VSQFLVGAPPSGDSYLRQLAALVNVGLARKEPELLGLSHSGTNLYVRFRARPAAPWIVRHLQSTLAGEGGATYDAVNYASSVEVDCRATPLQSATLVVTPGETYYLWLIPVQYDGAGTRILFDGVAVTEDAMIFAELGV